MKYAQDFAELKKNAHICIYSLADLNLGHFVESTFFEGKLGRFLMLTFLN